MDIQPIQSAVDQLADSFEIFKTKQEERLNLMEQKTLTQPAIITNPSVINHRPDTLLHEPVSSSEFKAYLRQGIPLLESKSLSTEDASGGFLVPKTLYDHILKDIHELSPLRPLARVMSISTSSAEILLNKKDPEVGWAAETAARNETAAPELVKITIPVHELYAKPKATQKLLDDAAVNVEEWLVKKVAEKMAQLETRAFLHGDGNGKPKGILAYETVTGDAWEWGKVEKLVTGEKGAFAKDAAADTLINTIYSMKSMYLKGSSWIMPRSALAAVRKLRDKTTGQYLWNPALGDRAATLLEYPVILCDEMPPLIAGTASQSIIFANLKEAYQIIDRSHLHVLRDPYSAKPFVEFYVTKRTGGDVINFEAIKVISFDKPE
jgi:HK97 family phage major capsid protein